MPRLLVVRGRRPPPRRHRPRLPPQRPPQTSGCSTRPPASRRRQPSWTMIPAPSLPPTARCRTRVVGTVGPRRRAWTRRSGRVRAGRAARPRDGRLLRPAGPVPCVRAMRVYSATSATSVRATVGIPRNSKFRNRHERIGFFGLGCAPRSFFRGAMPKDRKPSPLRRLSSKIKSTFDADGDGKARLLRPRRRREEGEGAGAGHGGLGGRRGDAAARQGRRRPPVEQGHVPDDRPRRRRQDRLQGRARRHAAGEPPGEERDLRRGEEQDARDLRGGVPHEAEAGDDGRPLHAVAHARRRPRGRQ